MTTATNAAATAATAPSYAIAYARLFGPQLATDASGQPSIISTGVFDLKKQTAVQAIAAAALKWRKIPINEADWILTLDEDVIQAAHGQRIPYDRVFTFDYAPDEPVWAKRGLDKSKVPASHLESCWYITHKGLPATSNASASK